MVFKALLNRDNSWQSWDRVEVERPHSSMCSAKDLDLVQDVPLMVKLESMIKSYVKMILESLEVLSSRMIFFLKPLLLRNPSDLQLNLEPI